MLWVLVHVYVNYFLAYVNYFLAGLLSHAFISPALQEYEEQGLSDNQMVEKIHTLLGTQLFRKFSL